jgi:hypothetical protein
LNIEDRITSLIRKQRLFHYPEGTDLAGVLREYKFDQTRPYGQWIRNIHFLDEAATQYIILCCTDAQANFFQEAEFIQIDLSFKMVHGNTNVFSISGWSEEHQGKFSISIQHMPGMYLLHSFNHIRLCLYKFRDSRGIPPDVS